MLYNFLTLKMSTCYVIIDLKESKYSSFDVTLHLNENYSVNYSSKSSSESNSQQNALNS